MSTEQHTDSQSSAALEHRSRAGLDPAALASDQRRRLDEDGYLLVRDALDPVTLARARDTVERHWREESLQAGSELGQSEPGTRRLSNLADKDPLWRGLMLTPWLLAAVDHVIARPFHLSSINARDPQRGYGHQGLHGDWGSHRGHEEPYQVVNSLWLLDDIGPDNGAPRLVPGSHRRGSPEVVGLADPRAPHPDEVVVEAPAGSALVINAHTWHGGTANRSGAPRRIVHIYFGARDQPQQQDQRAWLSAGTRAALSERERWLLDVD